MPLDRNSYNILLDTLDIIKLRVVQEQLLLSQQEVIPALLPLRIANLDHVAPIFRDISDDGVTRSHYLQCFKIISDTIYSLSMRESSIKTTYVNFPWDSLEKIYEVLKSTIEQGKDQGNFDSYNQYKARIDLNVEELVSRLEYMSDAVLYSKDGVKKFLDNTDELSAEDSFIISKYKGLKFVDERPIIQGLNNIRKLTEPSLDADRVRQIKTLISKIEDCNPSHLEGRAAILAITAMIGEIGKTISDQTKLQNSQIPFNSLKDLRNKVHDLDIVPKAFALLSLVQNDENQGLLGQIKDFVSTELKRQMDTIFIQDVDAFMPQNSDDPLPKIFSSMEEESHVNSMLDIITQSVPVADRNSNTTLLKLEVCHKILSGVLPIPTSTNLCKLLFQIMELGDGVQDFDRALYKNHDAKQQKNIKKITEDIKVLKSLDTATNYKKLYQHTQPDQVNIGRDKAWCFADLEKGLYAISDSIPKTKQESYISKQLEILTQSLEQITKHTKAKLEITSSYQGAREACSGTGFHFFHLFYLIVIGQAIQNLIGKPEFIQFAEPELLKEFEFLKWVRNSLMHNKDIDETGSVFSYFKNDLLDMDIREYGARAYDTNEYLQYIKPLVLQTLQNIKSHTENVSTNEKFFEHLMYKELEKAYQNHDEESEKYILQVLGQKLDPNINIHAQVGKVLQSNPILDLEGYVVPQVSGLEFLPRTKINGFLEHKVQILELAQRYNVDIIGLFGNIVQNGFVAWYEDIDIVPPCAGQIQNSGMLVEKRGSDIELALFKSELKSLLEHRLLVITKEHLQETLHVQGVENIDEQISEFLESAENNSIEILANSMMILRAIEKNKSSIAIRTLLDTHHEVNINLKYHGYTPLHKTCHGYSNNYDIFVLLVKFGADVNVQDKRGNTVAHYIVSGEVGDNWDVTASLNLLVEHGANFNLTNDADDTPLENASKYYNKNIVACRLLLHHTNLPIEQKLLQAIKLELVEDVRIFLQDITATSLVPASYLLNDEIEGYGLIGNIACGVGNFEIINLLTESGCDLEVVAEDGSTALEEACHADNAKQNQSDRIVLITKLIDEIKIPITARAINNALYCSDLEILKLLLDRGGDPNAPDVGMTPLLTLINQPCIDSHAMQAIEILLRYGADIFALDGYVGNALHLASERGHIGVIDLLLACAISLDQLDQLLQPSSCWVCNDMNAYEIAVKYGHYDIATKLEEYFPSVTLVQDVDNGYVAENESQNSDEMNSDVSSTGEGSVSDESSELV